MHSSLVRIQNVFGFFTTVAFVVAGLIAASDLLAPRTPSGKLSVGNIQVVRGRPHYYSTKKEEYANIRFNLDADLSSLFTWNTKQVFVYVSAIWPDDSAATGKDLEAGGVARPLNEAVVWDTIITAPSSDYLSTAGAATKKKLIRSAAGKSIDPSRGILKLRNQKPKYQITTPKGKVANLENITLHLHYNVQPWVGVLTWTPNIEFLRWKKVKGGISRVFMFPPLKATDGERRPPTA